MRMESLRGCVVDNAAKVDSGHQEDSTCRSLLLQVGSIESEHVLPRHVSKAKLRMME